MPLIDVIGQLFYYSISYFKTILISLGIDNNSKSFYICFAFLLDQKEELYTWVLNCIKELFSKLNTPTIITRPGIISTDCDQALWNAITTVFPDSSALLCAWHANKNIQQHYKGSFSTIEAWEAFFKAWQGIVSAQTQEKYKEQLHHFTITYLYKLAYTCMEYIRNIWLKPG